MKLKLEVIDIGKMNYKEAYQKQMNLLSLRLENKISDILLLTEHPSVYTIGRSGSRSNLIISEDDLKRKGIDVCEVNRGGDITYHGPGQIVGYPILNLENHRKDLHWLLHSYEEVFIRLLDDSFNISAQRICGLTGVWINENKITAIGLGVKKWITFHGFAFNINPNLVYFDYIIPCGIENKGVTSLERVLPEFNNKISKIKELVIKYFAEIFDMEVIDSE